MTDNSNETSNPYLAKQAAQDTPVAQAADGAPTDAQAAANVRAIAMINLVDKLIDVLERENALLDKPRSKDLGPVVAEKQGLFAEYEAMLRQTGNLSALMAEISPDRKAEILDRAKVFDTLLKENEIKLDAMVRSSEQVMRVMSDVARKMAQPIQGYGNKGAVSYTSKTSAPVAVNETL
tara:strand:- start:22 stop:558 length:537 start_codon:yes stop_codon:yes gene_type:complete